MSRINTLGIFGITVLAMLLSISVSARRTCADALLASQGLTHALLNRDTLRIKALVAADIAYGHSNGWIQSRPEMLRDLYNGSLEYQEIRLLDTPGCSTTNSVAVIRHRAAVSIEMKGTTLRMNLGVLQIWEYRRGKWLLVARQSCKIS
jgi:hypothetical protein